MLDLNLLRIMKHRQDFLRIRGRVPDTVMDAQTRAIIDDFGKYFQRFPDHDKIDMDVFLPLFRVWHSGLKDEQRNTFEGILGNVRKDVPDAEKQQIMRSVLELRMGTDLANLLAKFDAGTLPNILHEIQSVTDAFKADVGIKDKLFLEDDIHDILQETEAHGVSWRLDVLNQSMRNLQPGDFGIIAGRPDKGKTTFISSEITHMAPQLPPDQNVVWLNNEGPGKRIIPRVYQSALGATRTQLLTLMQANVLKQAYIKQVGRLDRIRIVDIHGMDNFSVEQIIEANNAGIVVYDMIDNIRGFGDAARTDLGLEKMYQWGRELAVRLGHVGLATSQISADGDGMQFPTMAMLKDSKTGKQGACDFQIMIGAMNDPGYGAVRFISTPKNKLRVDTGPADPRASVRYEPLRGRYSDMPVATAEQTEENETHN